MTKYRSVRFGEELKRQIAEIITREMKDPRLQYLVVHKVETTPDLGFARVYVSSLTDQDKKSMLTVLSNATGFIRRRLGDTLKARIVPELVFLYDDSVAYGIKMTEKIKYQIAEDERNAKRMIEENNDLLEDNIRAEK